MVSTQVSQTENIRTSNADRIGEAAFFLQSTFTDMDRSLNIATRRALTGTTNYVVLTGESLESPRDNVSEVLVNGTLNGNPINGTENASLKEWSSRVAEIADRSGYELSVRVENYSFNEDGMQIDSSFSVFGSLRDPTTLTTFNKTESANTTVSIQDVEDSMLLVESIGRYSNQYKSCGFTEPAEILYTGTQNTSGTFHGYAEKNPSDLSTVSDKSDKILVVNNVDSYQTSEVNNFGAVVSDLESSNPQTFSTRYVFGASSISDIDNNMSLIIKNENVWRSGFREMFREGCYVPDENGPGFFDRMEGKTYGEDEGLATLIDISLLPPELQKSGSSVGYVYFNESGDFGDLNEISGVSDEYSWFRLDQDHVDYWGIEDLVE